MSIINTFKIQIIVIILLFILIFICTIIFNNNKSNSSIIFNQNKINYQTDDAIIDVYSITGQLLYKLKTKKIYYFIQAKISYFFYPILIFYDQQGMLNWSVKANKAKLLNANMLYLYGNIEIKNLKSNSNLQKILGKNIVLNLNTQDVLSNDKVILLGSKLCSMGMRLRGNMRTKIIKLIGYVKTYYIINNK